MAKPTSFRRGKLLTTEKILQVQLIPGFANTADPLCQRVVLLCSLAELLTDNLAPGILEELFRSCWFLQFHPAAFLDLRRRSTERRTCRMISPPQNHLMVQGLGRILPEHPWPLLLEVLDHFCLRLSPWPTISTAASRLIMPCCHMQSICPQHFPVVGYVLTTIVIVLFHLRFWIHSQPRIFLQQGSWLKQRHLIWDMPPMNSATVLI